MEKQAILDALGSTRGNVREAARLLGCGQATVYRKIKRYGIVLEDQGRTAMS
jgi:transcriptional regulator of acetoin/glycerol metabolism